MQQIGKYQLQGVLGQGGMGIVYRSFHPHLNRPVAIKLILAGSADTEARQRFLREAQVIAGLSHPNIIRIFDVDVQEGQPYLVMELVEGGSLADRVGQPITPDQVVALAVPLAQALDYAHSQGIVHRDLKPANVLLRADGTPVLADFGLAREANPQPDQRVTATGAVLGTLAYMAPEQLSSRPLDGRTDIYALGVLLFEVLTGQLPFLGDTGQMLLGHLQMPPPAPVTLNSAIPAELSRLVLWMLAKSPDDRPQRAAEVAEALQAIQARLVSTVKLPAGALPSQAAQAAAPPTIPVPLLGPTAVSNSLAAAPVSGLRLPPLLIGVLLLGVFLAGVLGLGALLRLGSGGSASDVRPTPALSRSPAAQATARAGGLEAAATAPARLRPTSPPEPTDAPAPPLALLEAPPMAEAKSVGPEQFSVSVLTQAETSGARWFFGEVRNDGAEPREGVTVRVILSDREGKEVGSKVGYADRSYLAPGEVSPFSVLFSDTDGPIPEFASRSIEVRSSKLSSRPGFLLRTLAIEDVRTAVGSYGNQVVSGKLRNTGEEMIAFPQVIVTFYDAEGKVVGLQNAYAETDDTKALEPNAIGRFEVSWQIFSGQPTSYLMVVQGLRHKEAQ